MTSFFSQERKDEIAEYATFVANRYCTNIRTRPELIASEVGITYSFDHYDAKFDGLLHCAQDEFHIHINLNYAGSDDSVRSRFTFCHELGHYFIDDHRLALLNGRNLFHPSIYGATIRKPLVEKEADHFASHLLMPSDRFCKAVSKNRERYGLDFLLELQKRFNASILATAIRLVEEDIYPSCIIKWDIDGEREWFWSSASSGPWTSGNPIKKLPLYDNTLATVLAKKEVFNLKGKVYEKKIFSEFYFPNASSFGGKPGVIMEHAINLKKFGVFTFLFKVPPKPF